MNADMKLKRWHKHLVSSGTLPVNSLQSSRALQLPFFARWSKVLALSGIKQQRPRSLYVDGSMAIEYLYSITNGKPRTGDLFYDKACICLDRKQEILRILSRLGRDVIIIRRWSILQLPLWSSWASVDQGRDIYEDDARGDRSGKFY